MYNWKVHNNTLTVLVFCVNIFSPLSLYLAWYTVHSPDEDGWIVSLHRPETQACPVKHLSVLPATKKIKQNISADLKREMSSLLTD